MDRHAIHSKKLGGEIAVGSRRYPVEYEWDSNYVHWVDSILSGKKHEYYRQQKVIETSGINFQFIILSGFIV